MYHEIYFRINYSDDGKKHGECSLFNSLEFPSYAPVSSNENQVQNSLPLIIDNVVSNNEKSNSPENAMVC